MPCCALSTSVEDEKARGMSLDESGAQVLPCKDPRDRHKRTAPRLRLMCELRSGKFKIS